MTVALTTTFPVNPAKEQSGFPGRPLAWPLLSPFRLRQRHKLRRFYTIMLNTMLAITVNNTAAQTRVKFCAYMK